MHARATGESDCVESGGGRIASGGQARRSVTGSALRRRMRITVISVLAAFALCLVTTASAFAFTAQEKTLVGSMYGSADPAVTAAGVLQASLDGEMDLARMLGPSFGLDEINEGIAVALAGDQGRTTILPDGPTD